MNIEEGPMIHIWELLVANWGWVALSLLIGVVTTYYVFSTQGHGPVRTYTKDLYETYGKTRSLNGYPHFTLGNTVIEIAPFPAFCMLLLVIFWPINLLLLLWIRVGGD